MTSPRRRKSGKQALKGKGSKVPGAAYGKITGTDALAASVTSADIRDRATRRIAAAIETRVHQKAVDAAIAAGGNVTPIGTGRPTLRYTREVPVVETPQDEVVQRALAPCTEEHVKPGYIQIPQPVWTLKDARDLLEQGYRPEWVAHRCKVDLEAVLPFMHGMPYTEDHAEIQHRAPALVHHGTVDGYWWHRSIKKNRVCEACRAAYNAENDLPVPPAPAVYVDPDVDLSCREKRGTPAGYQRHRYYKKQACPECKRANADKVSDDNRKRRGESVEASPAPAPRKKSTGPKSGKKPACVKESLTGTAEGFLRHRKWGEKACQPCKDAWAADAQRTA